MTLAAPSRLVLTLGSIAAFGPLSIDMYLPGFPAMARDVHTLIALRLVQAVGGCAGMVIVVAIVRDLYDSQNSARMFSRLMLVMRLAPILAPFAGTYVVGWFGWRALADALSDESTRGQP